MSKRVEPTRDAPILLTMGEPAGIGPEIAVKAFHELDGRIGKHILKLVGDEDVFIQYGIRYKQHLDGRSLVAAQPVAVWPKAGNPNSLNASAVTNAIETAVAAAMRGEAAAVITAPINKAVLSASGFGFPGHTEFLAHLTKVPRAVMMLASDKLRVVPLTIHMPIADVPRAITTESIVETGEIALAALARDFSIAQPRLAISGLNPHPGEFGDEEGRVIAPAVAALKKRGHDVRGPLPADTLFHEESRATYDAALCMYHDQALIPIKTLSFWDGVNVTLGLPIVRTSPDHGTAFDIAGTGKADPRSMIAAIRMAAEIADAERADPLPPLREVIAAHGLTAKKSLGQNFLFDLNLTRRIARAAGPLEGTTVYEIGPGPGGLTRALLTEGAAKVVAVERDERCLPALEEIAAAWPGQLDVIQADALGLDETKLFGAAPIRIAANLPYNVGTALLVKWLTVPSWPPFWQSLALMFQREVAERIVASPDTEHYGRLSVLAQWRTRPKILFDVSRQAFTPPPKITSSIVRIEPLVAPVAPVELRDLEKVTEAAFGQRRKMLRQSLKQLVPDAEALLGAAGVDPTARPEQLSVAEFASLARAYRAR